MKKQITKPLVSIDRFEDIDVIATSEGIQMTSEGDSYDARSRKSSIWDD